MNAGSNDDVSYCFQFYNNTKFNHTKLQHNNECLSWF